MYLYAFENHKCTKSPSKADKNDILEKHQKSPIKSDFVYALIKYLKFFCLNYYKMKKQVYKNNNVNLFS